MTLTYIVKSGDWLAKIAEDHGTTVSAIWNHPENAAHRQKRGSPDVLYPGDVLRIDVAEPVQPSAVAPPVSPPNPPEAPPTATLTPEWPYPPFEGPWSTAPTWECPGGTCACHPVPEDGPKEEHVIVFYDSQGVRMPGARCRVYEQGRLLTPEPSSTDGAGELRVELREGTATLRVEWAPSNLPAHEFLPYRKVYNVKMSDDDGDVGLDRRLANLGFARGRRRRDNVADYQRAYSREPSGNADEIRLEVLERHDNGTVTPFHPQAPAGATESAPLHALALFASPPPRSSSSSLRQLAPDEPQGGGDTGEGVTRSGQNVQGAAVPDAADLLLLVMLSPDFSLIQPKNTKVRLRPRDVPGLTGDQREREIKPTIEPLSAGTAAAYEFKDLPTGTYDALVYIDEISRGVGKHTTFALGHTEVAVRKAFVNRGLLIAHIGRPVLTVDDPVLDFDVPPMQRRRKVLAAIFELFPASHAPAHTLPEIRGKHPPYGQGDFEKMQIGKNNEDTCTPVNGSVMLNASGVAVGAAVIDKAGWVAYSSGLAPSVGDTVYYGTKEKFDHVGIVVESSVTSGSNWISADGGQPDRTSIFKKLSTGGWGRAWDKPDFIGQSYQSMWLVGRQFFDVEGQGLAAHSWASPVINDPVGYGVVGWRDITAGGVTFPNEAFDSTYREEHYRACKVLIRTVRRGILEDQAVCRATYDRENP